MIGLFCSTNAKTNEEYKKVIKKRMLIMLGIITIGVITAGITLYAYYFMHLTGADKILGVYTGLGTGLIVGGLIILIKNAVLLNNEEKLKQSRLNNSDERIQEIGNKAFKVAATIMIALLYITVIIKGIFDPEIFRIFLLLISTFIVSYMIAFKIYNSKM